MVQVNRLGSIDRHCRHVGLLPALALGLISGCLASDELAQVRMSPAPVGPTGAIVFAAGVGDGGPATGEADYQSQCAACHGSSGKGDG